MAHPEGKGCTIRWPGSAKREREPRSEVATGRLVKKPQSRPERAVGRERAWGTKREAKERVGSLKRRSFTAPRFERKGLRRQNFVKRKSLRESFFWEPPGVNGLSKREV